MRTARQLIIDIAEMSEFAMDKTEVHDKPTISINEAMAMIIAARSEALKEAAEVAKTHKTGNSGSWFDASVDKESILSLLKDNV